MQNTQTAQFKLPIGTKRQVTIPKDFMDMLSLEEGNELLLEVAGGQVTLTPIVSVRRDELPPELRKKFEARRGAKPSDLPLSQFLGKIGYKPAKKARIASRLAAGGATDKARRA